MPLTPPARLQRLRDAAGIRTQDNLAAIADADIVVLAVKPQVIQMVAEALGELTERQPLVVSIVAGIRCDALARWLGNDITLIRTMPTHRQ